MKARVLQLITIVKYQGYVHLAMWQGGSNSQDHGHDRSWTEREIFIKTLQDYVWKKGSNRFKTFNVRSASVVISKGMNTGGNKSRDVWRATVTEHIERQATATEHIERQATVTEHVERQATAAGDKKVGRRYLLLILAA